MCITRTSLSDLPTGGAGAQVPPCAATAPFPHGQAQPAVRVATVQSYGGDEQLQAGGALVLTLQGVLQPREDLRLPTLLLHTGQVFAHRIDFFLQSSNPRSSCSTFLLSGCFYSSLGCNKVG